MFGIAEFNQEVMEHPEILIPIIEEEEEDEDLQRYYMTGLDDTPTGDGGKCIGELFGLLLPFAVLWKILDYAAGFALSCLQHMLVYKVQICAACFACTAALLFMRRRTGRIGQSPNISNRKAG